MYYSAKFYNWRNIHVYMGIHYYYIIVIKFMSDGFNSFPFYHLPTWLWLCPHAFPVVWTITLH